MDSDGESINSKEYLEKALKASKGFSDIVEEKNRIRRLLKDFFQDRDCCTLIRPVANEADLQNLEELEINSLRPEFVSQMEEFRKKVLSEVKPKTLNGKELNGEMLAALIENYISAINNGAVPNIEST